MIYSIPFNRASLQGKEFEYIQQAISNGHLSGDGPFSRKCAAFLKEQMSIPAALLTTSCTHALEMAALLMNVRPGDEVIFPSFTFVSTVNAFVLRGARPVFVDIRPDTLNIDETRIDKNITKRTRALVVVHYAGVGCEMDDILSIARQGDLPVIEDNAHGLFGKYKGRYLGTFGCMATQSFHETKNFTCGEGGALLINDEQYIERAEIIREKGTDRSRFYRGLVDKYTWRDVGSSYLPSEILAAFLWAQFEQWQFIQSSRKSIWNRYDVELSDWAKANGVGTPHVPENCEQPYHMFYLMLPSFEARRRMIHWLKEKGILAVFHYLPLHVSPMGQKFGGKKGDCPVTEDVSQRILRLPFYNSLTRDDQQRVIDAVRQFEG